MPINKLFKSLDKQIDIQRSRKLNISNVSQMKKDLLRYNYFNIINAFEDLLLYDLNPKEYKNKSFNDFKRLYFLDRKMSKFLFENILKVENEIKTSIAYFFCEKYCDSNQRSILSYLDSTLYNGARTSGADVRSQNMFNNHILFRHNNGINVICNNISFTGSINDSTNPRYTNKKLLDGTFIGDFKGLSNNIFEGILFVDARDLVSVGNGNVTNLNLNANIKGYLRCYKYSDYCKIKYSYISKYTDPPMWVIINTFTIKQIYYLYIGLDESIKTDIIKSVSGDGFFFNGSLNKESFLMALELLAEVRNKVYHGDNISLIRSPSNIKINPILINNLDLEPKSGRYYDIRLLDIIKIFDLFNSFDLSKIVRSLRRYRLINKLSLKSDINLMLMDRIGRF